MKFRNEGEGRKVRIDDKYHLFATVKSGEEIDLEEVVGKRYGFIPVDEAEIRDKGIEELKAKREEKKEKPKKPKTTKGKAGKKDVETKQIEGDKK